MRSQSESGDGKLTDEAVLPYSGTEGFVSGSDTSRARATADASSGGAWQRQTIVLEALDRAPNGMTWKELGDRLNLHHGKISGTLSVLHGAGKIAMLKTKRENCHPYIAMRYAVQFHPSLVIWEPSKTLSRLRREAMEKVVDAARLVSVRADLLTLAELDRALADLDAIDNT